MGILDFLKQNNKLRNYITLPEPNDSIAFFEEIKTLSNIYCSETDINKGIFGYQIQKYSPFADIGIS